MKKLITDESGLLTIDFIFASVLVGGFTSILFSLMFTLSVVEITQYITFATSRSFFAAHWSADEQFENGNNKFIELTTNPQLQPLYNNGWFEIEGPGIQDWNELYPQSPDSTGDSANFIGSRVTLNAKLLNINIPLIGGTSDDDETFKVNIASYLNREPSSSECLSFFSDQSRMNSIKQLDSSYNNPLVKDYTVIADNGC